LVPNVGYADMRQRRRGFTLVEILVALALTIFILSILSQAFVTGADTFRTLKAIGDMNASLRIAANRLRADLAADHFEGKRRLSDPSFWTVGPPEQGYFYLDQRKPFAPVAATPNVSLDTGVGEGPDAIGNTNIPSFRVTTHRMAFTVKAKGTRPEDFFSAKVPALANIANDLTTANLNPNLTINYSGTPDGRYQNANSFNSQWIEVCYWLEPIYNGGGILPTANGTQLYALYRQQRLVIGYSGAINWQDSTTAAKYARVPYSAANLAALQPVVSCKDNPDKTGKNNAFMYFNSPADLTIPERRTAGAFAYRAALPPTVPPSGMLGGNGAAASPGFARQPAVNGAPYPNANVAPTGDDLLLTDVISFDVEVLQGNLQGTTVTPAADFAALPNPNYFDTWSRREDDAYNYAAKSKVKVPGSNPATYYYPYTQPIPMAALGSAANPTPTPTYNILALRITIRIWDPRTQLSRQMTIVQDM
jgi:prepilin-type N-terminal cleavage/methylation domain-containing protein